MQTWKVLYPVLVNLEINFSSNRIHRVKLIFTERERFLICMDLHNTNQFEIKLLSSILLTVSFNTSSIITKAWSMLRLKLIGKAQKLWEYSIKILPQVVEEDCFRKFKKIFTIQVVKIEVQS